MKKFVLTVLIVNALIWGLLSSIQAKANDYNTAVIGHVIQNHKDIDHSKLLEAELSKMMHSVSIEMVSFDIAIVHGVSFKVDLGCNGLLYSHTKATLCGE